MGRRKISKEHIRNLQNSKGSYYISIPIRIIRSLKWKERQKLIVKKFGKKKIVISDWQK